MPAKQKPTATIGRWFLVWTTIGCIFALQLRWYYELTWTLSIFWGLADWYLWGLLALLFGKALRRLKASHTKTRSRAILYVFFAPVIAALHVALTIVIGEIGSFSVDMPWIDYFQVLYAKKLTLNLITYAAIVLIYERLSEDKPRQTSLFLTKLGDATRLVSAEEIIWGEVCGNYVNLHTKDGVWPLRDTLTGLLNRLPDREFVRISRSTMVRLNQVREQCSVGRALILLLDNGAKVRVSRRYRPFVRQALRDHCLCDQQQASTIKS